MFIHSHLRVISCIAKENGKGVSSACSSRALYNTMLLQCCEEKYELHSAFDNHIHLSLAAAYALNMCFLLLICITSSIRASKQTNKQTDYMAIVLFEGYNVDSTG